jgi:hypothetical protein
MEMIFSWLKYRSSFISRRVLRQNIEWSKGVIFLIATFCPLGLCSAELYGRGQHTGYEMLRPYTVTAIYH